MAGVCISHLWRTWSACGTAEVTKPHAIQVPRRNLYENVFPLIFFGVTSLLKLSSPPNGVICVGTHLQSRGDMNIELT